VAAVNDSIDLTYWVNEDWFKPSSGSITTLPSYGGKLIRMGAWTNSQGELTGKIAFGGIWNRRLKDPELALLRADPYGIIRLRRRVFKVGVAPAGRTTRNTRAYPLGVDVGMEGFMAGTV
jgi:hypothetical protein